MNENTSKMAAADYRLVPDSTNYVESAHAHLNARTNIQLPLLSAIISNKQSDDRDVDEVDQIETGAVIANDNNGLGQRERAMAQRMRSKVKQRALREENVGEYLALEAEEAAGDRAWSASLDREKLLKEQIASLRRSRADSAKLRIKALQKEVKAGSDARRVWRARKGVIKEKMKSLRADELHGVRIPRPAPSDGTIHLSFNFVSSDKDADTDQGAEDVEPMVPSNPDDPLGEHSDLRYPSVR
uniref:Uncharacterized protein n=1 Tax=Mycena chlorophos TaxID=658473 RepID=A0ABQ0KY59_MYCCL|nr:predicted protein [Mycena chlorophos]